MMPTLIAGDFIVVNKFAYGVRFPIWNKILINLGTPNRGDIFVFHYPKNPSIDYIKRVIGLPGDEIRYENKQLFINGEAINKTFQSKYSYAFNDDESLDASEFIEELNNSKYSILIHDIPSENYKFNVPEGYYFAMGDNRDNSSDSRYWGFVPRENFMGTADYIWMSWECWTCAPSFERAGKIN